MLEGTDIPRKNKRNVPYTHNINKRTNNKNHLRAGFNELVPFR